jgi:hypothetical protein
MPTVNASTPSSQRRNVTRFSVYSASIRVTTLGKPITSFPAAQVNSWSTGMR